jgi:hypothetical protein
MIGTAISYIRKRLDGHLQAALAIDSDGSARPLVDFVDGEKLDPLSVPMGTIGMVVVNVNEERGFSDANRFQRRIPDGAAFRMVQHHPDIHLEIVVLFLAKFKDYVHAWNQLSQVMAFFQQHSFFDAEQDSDLPDGIGRLVCELCSQSFQQQNELWSSLKISLQPAVLYRFRLLTLSGQPTAPQPLPVQAVRTQVVAHDRRNTLRSPPPVEALPDR